MLTKKQELYNLLNSLSQAKKKSHSTILVQKRFSHSTILKKLKLAGVIESFYEETHVVLIKLNLKSFSQISTSSASISFCRAKQDIRRQGGASVSFIRTDKGLLVSPELLKHNIGGYLITLIS